MEQEQTIAARQLRYMSREDREDFVYSASRNLPAWAAGNPYTYFEAAERHEGKGWNAYEEWKIALPAEFSHGQNVQVARDLVRAIARERLPVTYAFHDPPTLRGTKHQPHLHLMISARQTDAHDRGPERHFKRWNGAHPERGGAQKDPMMNHWDAVKHHRVVISDIVNLHLERRGVKARVHPDSLEARGIERAPEPKLWPKESREYREQGMVSPTMQRVLDSRAVRGRTWDIEQANAQQYWEERKHQLGIGRPMEMAQALERIRAGREQAMTHAPVRVPERSLAREIEAIERRVTGLERVGRRLQSELSMERWYEHLGKERPEAGQRVVELALADAKAHGIAVELARTPQREAPVRARTLQREREAPTRERTPQRQRAVGMGMAVDDDVGGGVHVRVEERERGGYGYES